MTQEIPQFVIDLIKGDRPMSVLDVQQGIEYLDLISLGEVLALCRSLNPQLNQLLEDRILREETGSEEETVQTVMQDKAVGTENSLFWE